MKKVIFVPFITAFGGVERLILSLAKNLKKEQVHITIVCFRETVGLASSVDFQIDIVELRPPRNSILEGWYLYRYLREVGAKDVYSLLVFDLNGAFYAGMFSNSGYTLHLTDPPSLLPTDISKYAPSNSQAGFTSIHSLKAELVHRINRRGVRKSRHVISMTKVIREEIWERYDVEAVIVRPGIELSTKREKNSDRSNDDFHFLSVSRLEENKRLDWIISSLHELECLVPALSSSVDWRLDIVGSGDREEALRTQVSDLGLDNRVVFHGRLSDNELEERYREARLFLMPAVQGYGLPALEALSRGVPVVLHRDSGVSEILEESTWVSLMSDYSDSLKEQITIMIERIINGELSRSDIPPIPTDVGWSQQIDVFWNDIYGE